MILEDQLDKKSSHWVLPSKKELSEYYDYLTEDSGLGHKVMNLVDLISNKKFIFPLIIEFERTERKPELMAELSRDHYCILTKKKIKGLFSKKSRVNLSDQNLVI